MNNDDVIFDDEEFLDDEEFGKEENPSQEGPEDNKEPLEENDLITEVLRLQGISDLDKIKFEDDNGAIIERPWSSLSRDEQLSILMNQEAEDTALEDSEIELINYMRSNGMSVQDFVTSIQNQTAQVKEPQRFDVEDLSDEKLFALDLIDRVGYDNITDEEIEEAIENAKKNESLFKKTVEGIRNEYIQLQKDEESQLEFQRQEEQRTAFNNFSNSIVNEIRNLNSFAGQDLELTEEEAQQLYSYILDLDNTGVSAFGKALQDPTIFTKAAFWTLHENQIAEELTKQIQDSYKRGYEAAKKDFNKSSNMVIKPKNEKTSTFDDYVDDEEWY